jgi:hypothetical protein
MKRLVPPDKAVVETGVPRPGGGESVYRMRRDGTIHVSDADAKMLKKAGYTEPSLGGFARAAGWICDECGFHGYFRKCGKCGSENTHKGQEVE